MGYNLHITRANNHSDNDGHWITAEEWLRCVEEDPELKLAGYNGDYFALWSGKSEYPDPWLDWFAGNIYSKNPDDAIIDKMVEIARKLNARVQGDDGEIYIGGGRNNFIRPTEPPILSAAPKRCSWAWGLVALVMVGMLGFLVPLGIARRITLIGLIVCFISLAVQLWGAIFAYKRFGAVPALLIIVAINFLAALIWVLFVARFKPGLVRE